VAQAVLESAGRFARCQHPKCSLPLFVARRKGQKYCERGDCTAYAQSQYALKWWEREGKKRRAKKQKAKRRGKKSRKKKSRSQGLRRREKR